MLPHHAIDGGEMAGEKCQVCDEGTYAVLVGPDDQRQLQNKFGIGGAAPGKVVLLRCTECGHLLWFYDPPKKESEKEN